MVQVYLIPQWFVATSILMELVVTLISFAISYFAWKIYRITKEREIKFFSIGFLSIAIAYLMWSLLNLVMLTDIGGDIRSLAVTRVNYLGAGLLAAYFALFIAGWYTLNYASFRTKSIRAFILPIIIGFIAIYISVNKATAFYLVSLALIFFMVAHYYVEYFRRKNARRFLTFASFLLIFISRAELFFSPNSYLHYAVGHSVELIGYVLLLINLFIILKNGQKK